MSKQDKSKPKAKKAKKKGFVYMMDNPSRPGSGTKVGRSKHPKQRRKEIEDEGYRDFSSKGENVRLAAAFPTASPKKAEKAAHRELGMNVKKDGEITHKPKSKVRKVLKKVTGNKKKKGG